MHLLQLYHVFEEASIALQQRQRKRKYGCQEEGKQSRRKFLGEQLSRYEACVRANDDSSVGSGQQGDESGNKF